MKRCFYSNKWLHRSLAYIAIYILEFYSETYFLIFTKSFINTACNEPRDCNFSSLKNI